MPSVDERFELPVLEPVTAGVRTAREMVPNDNPALK
jgi:hypothetical protein